MRDPEIEERLKDLVEKREKLNEKLRNLQDQKKLMEHGAKSNGWKPADLHATPQWLKYSSERDSLLEMKSIYTYDIKRLQGLD